MPKPKTKGTPLKSKAPGLKRFKTEERLAEYLKKEYWDKGRYFREIAEDCGVTPIRIRELFVKFHIRARRPGPKASRKPH